MLDAGRAPQRIAGLTLFFDHADAQRRYVLAETPRLVANPDPQLSLVLFRGEQAGGLLQLEATLAPTEAQLAAVERELTESGRTPTLARPDWRSGVVRVAGWLQAQELAPKLLVVAPPSLVGDPVSVIAARVDAAGAALADASLRDNALPTVVIFELETLGLSGPLGVTAEADLHAIHDRLTAEGALTTPYGRARIAKTWESAARDNLIRVRVVDETGDIESQRAEAMRRVGEDLLARMFSPFPPPERPRQLDDGTVAPLELSFRLTVRREELATSSRWDFRERRAVTIKHYAAASLIHLLGDRDPADHITFADLGEIQREVVIRAEPELSRLGLAALEVDLRHSGAASVHQTVVLTDAKPELRLRTEAGDGPLQFRVRARFDPALTRADDRETDWQEAAGGLIAVSARRLFPPRVFTVIAGRVELDWLDHVAVRVEALEELPRTLILTADAPSADAFLPGAGGRAVTVTSEWRGRRDEPMLTEAPREVEDDLLVLDSPFAESINVLVVPLPLSDIVTTVVELRTQHDSFVHTKTESWDAPDRAPRRVGLRRLVGSPREFSYRVQFIREDGTIGEKPWASSDRSTLVIGAEGATEVRTTEVVLLGGGPASRGSVAVELVLESGAHRTQDLLEGERDSATLALVVPEGAPVPVLTAREFLSSGEVRETRWEDPEAIVVLPPVPVATQ